MKYAIIFLSIFIFIYSCDTSTPLTHSDDELNIYEAIEHSAIHIQDANGYQVVSDTVLPGRHLETDSIDHRKTSVTLVPSGNLFDGIVHFGPAITGDILLGFDKVVGITLTNRTAQGDTPLTIEESFTEKQILDSAKTSFIKSAFLFEAQSGANCIKITGSPTQVINMVIKEVEHEDHD